MTISVYRGVGVVCRGSHPTLGRRSWAINCDKEPVSNTFFAFIVRDFLQLKFYDFTKLVDFYLQLH
jgi:hypothetical protein